MGKLVRLLLGIVGLIVIVVLAVNNRQIVELSFYPLPFTYETYVFAVFFGGLVIGSVLGWMAQIWASHDRRVEARRLKRRYVAEQVRADVLRRQEEEEAAKKVRERQQATAPSGRPLAISAPGR